MFKFDDYVLKKKPPKNMALKSMFKESPAKFGFVLFFNHLLSFLNLGIIQHICHTFNKVTKIYFSFLSYHYI